MAQKVVRQVLEEMKAGLARMPTTGHPTARPMQEGEVGEQARGAWFRAVVFPSCLERRCARTQRKLTLLYSFTSHTATCLRVK
jgi:hypothetical protein